MELPGNPVAMNMTPAGDDLSASDPDAVDRHAARENPAVEQGIAIVADPGAGRDGHQVGRGTNGDAACRRYAERLLPTPEGGIEHRTSCRNSAGREHISRTPIKALGVFQLAKFARYADTYIRIGPDPVPTSGGEKHRSRERPIAQVRLRHRAHAGDPATSRQRNGFMIRHVRGVDQAPALIDRRVIEQPLNRALPRPGEAIGHFLLLFGNMDVDWTVRRHL